MAKAPRKFDFEETTTGHPPREDVVIKKAVAQFRSLLSTNWNLIREFREASDNQSVGVSFSVNFNHAAKRPIVKGKLSFSRRASDEAQDICDDPDQKKLPLGD